MNAWLRRRKPLLLTFGALILLTGGITAGRLLGRAQHGMLGRATDATGLTAAEAATLDSAQEGVVLAQRKRVMGRLRSLEMVRRTATQIRPILDRAIEQREIQGD